MLESLPLAGASWLPCALPGARDHCLVVQLASGARPRELVLRAPTRERVLDLLAQLDAASQVRSCCCFSLRALPLQSGACVLHALEGEQCDKFLGHPT